MSLSSLVDVLVDIITFVIYVAVLIKLYKGWKVVKAQADQERRGQLSAILGLLALVVVCFLVGNGYALVFYGKTYLSLHVFQMFIVGNCVVYWLMIDILTETVAPTQGSDRESADRAG